MALIRLPGIIDIHVHLRDPGAIRKEDFLTGGNAALRGGVIYMIDMPNNPIPTITPQRIQDKINRSARISSCPVGFYYGTDGNNAETFSSVWGNPNVFGLKIYCNQTTGPLLIEDENIIEKLFAAWQSEKPILVHAVGEKLDRVLHSAQYLNRRLHVCHVASVNDAKRIRKAKKSMPLLSAGVTPHHLFLTCSDERRLGSYAKMMPPLGSKKDQEALWDALSDGSIDCVESDHAPHTREEKISDNPPFGVPGLETTLGLLLKAVHDRRITIDQLIQWTYTTPKQLFRVPIPRTTYIEVDPEKPYRVGQYGYETKCGWSPFHNWELYGSVQKVVINGRSISSSV